MKIQCIFEDNIFLCGKNFFTCVVSKQIILEKNEIRLTGCNGYQEIINEEVRAVVFKDCQITKVPQGLTKIFPNLKILSIWRSNLKTVTKTDLIEYRNIERIGFCNNLIEYFPGDLFEGFRNLNEIGMFGNKLKIIEPNVLDGLDKLEHVDFRDNDKYTKCYSKLATYQSNATLDDVKNEIFVRYYKDHKNIDKMLKSGDENKVLRNSNDFLTQRVQRLENEIRDLRQKLDRSEKIQKILNLQKKLDGINLANPDVKKQKSPLKVPTNIITDLRNLLQTDEIFKDLKVVIDGREFPVHKILIAARSPTLAEILRNNPEVENLNLIDISVDIFEIILKFLYTDELPGDDGTNFLHLFAAAGKLKIEELKKYSGTQLINQVDGNNALDILKMSNKYQQMELKHKSFDVLKKEYPKIVFEDEWATDIEKVIKIIEAFKMKEELINKAEKEFQDLMSKSKD
ncbi:hypothetical protein ACKWTF_015203 [Chironomus riparius]